MCQQFQSTDMLVNMGAQTSEVIGPDNISGAIRFEAFLITRKSRNEAGKSAFVQACVENGFADLPGSAGVRIGAEGGAAHAGMGEKMGIIAATKFRQGHAGSAVCLVG
jgi:hypothetical protein